MITKICSTCKIDKEVRFFEKDKRYKSGYRSQCRSCRYTIQETNRYLKRIYRQYGLTPEEYNEFFDSQNGLCAICHRPYDEKKRPAHLRDFQPKANRKLSVDHCHETGKVRGLLCQRCNTGLGFFSDNLELMRSAVQYLENHE